MKKITTYFGQVIGVLLIGSLCFVACEEKKDTQLADYDMAVESSEDCGCQSNWFPHSQTPPPEDGIGSPFDVDTTTNCIFHQWAVQKFLWLTKPNGSNPLFIDSTLQVTSNMLPVSPVTGATVVMTDTFQAGSEHAVLRTNPAYNSGNTSYTVHYSIHISDTLQSAADNFKAQLNGGSLPATNDSVFPVGSLELKMAWVETAAIDSLDLNNFFVTTAAFPQSNGDYQNKQVALLGMHVVGVVINHPEFIWATFEHNSMAPIFDWVDSSVSSSEQTLLFATDTTGSIDGIVWNTTTNAPTVANQAFSLFPYGVPLNAGAPPPGLSHNFMKTSQSEPTNYNNIDSLNQCFSQNVGDLWQNYQYDGALWIDTDGLSPQQQADTLRVLAGKISSADSNSIARGSLNSSNLAMETFAQTFQDTISAIDVSNLANCFSCHNSRNTAAKEFSPLYISHIFNNYLLTNNLSRSQIDSVEAAHFKQLHSFLKE